MSKFDQLVVTKLLGAIRELALDTSEPARRPVAANVSDNNSRQLAKRSSQAVLGTAAAGAASRSALLEGERVSVSCSGDIAPEPVSQALATTQPNSQDPFLTDSEPTMAREDSWNDNKGFPGGSNVPPHARRLGHNTPPSAGNPPENATAVRMQTEVNIEKDMANLTTDKKEASHDANTVSTVEYAPTALERQFKKSTTPYGTEKVLTTPVSMSHADHAPIEDDYLTKQYAYGSKLMMKMGWSPGSGLGARGKGIKDPISPLDTATGDASGFDRSGVGFPQQRDRVTARNGSNAFRVTQSAHNKGNCQQQCSGRS